MVKEFLKFVETTKSLNTYKTYSNILGYWFPDGQTNLDAEYIKQKLEQWKRGGVSTNTIANRLQVLNSFVKYLEAKGEKINDELKMIARAVKREEKIPRVATMEQVVNLINHVDNKKYKAIIAMLFYCGLRVSEVVNLNMEDIHHNKIIIRNTKNKRDRVIPISSELYSLIKDYIKTERYNTSPALFTTPHGRISENVIQRQVARYAAELGYNLSCHSFRHGAGTHLLQNGIDLRTIQAFLGHKSIVTTQRYTHVTNAMLQNAISVFKT